MHFLESTCRFNAQLNMKCVEKIWLSPNWAPCEANITGKQLCECAVCSRVYSPGANVQYYFLKQTRLAMSPLNNQAPSKGKIFTKSIQPLKTHNTQTSVHISPACKNNKEASELKVPNISQNKKLCHYRHSKKFIYVSYQRQSSNWIYNSMKEGNSQHRQRHPADLREK